MAGPKCPYGCKEATLKPIEEEKANLKAVLAGEAPEPEEVDLEEKPARFSFKEMMIPSSALPVEDVATAANARLAKAREVAAVARGGQLQGCRRGTGRPRRLA